MIIFGIDPGVSGAIVAMREDGSIDAHMPMPTFVVGTKNRVNGVAIAAFFRNYLGQHCKAVLEHVGAMPGQGTASMFSFGHSAGVAEGVLQGMDIPYQLIRPQAWKKRAGLIGKDKDAARTRCVQMYPELRVLDLKGKGQAVSDAILLGRFGAGLSVDGTD